ncbi:hypothetical protein [Ciceribacter sp. RN22]|uniref:hypothetical protein n=1 Tax=Ciceribacter sp. RN22 TaxID=2954932 RepID=UPI00209339EE|nr:hypothetical protein [Ciceribacter sp. RN22]MCO6181046.1 hypothetical protein [Ciceribacter sp. RN22]
MRNPERWDKIIWAADRIWASTDNMWKVSRWFGLGFVALAANEVTSDVPVGLFGLVASAIGLLSLGAWFFRAQADGLSRRSIGFFQTAVVTLLVLAISTYLATALWSLLRFMAYPVLVG